MLPKPKMLATSLSVRCGFILCVILLPFFLLLDAPTKLDDHVSGFHNRVTEPQST